jgi:epoxide hydrolase 4
LKSEFVSANGIRFHCLVAGNGPLMLLLHGFPQYSKAWRRQIPVLSEHFTVVAPDLRGYGRSDKPRGVSAYRPDVLSADVAGLVRAFGREKAVIVGHDWGGGLAWGTALDHPEVVEKLVVLNCPHPGVFLSRVLRPPQLFRSWYVFFFQLPWLPELALRGKAGALIAASAQRPQVFSDEDRREFTAAFDQPGVATAALNYYRAAFRASADVRRSAAKKISAPTLVIWGDQDQALGPELPDAMDGLFSGPLRVEHVPRASHWVAEEEPELVNKLILEFATGSAGPATAT